MYPNHLEREDFLDNEYYNPYTGAIERFAHDDGSSSLVETDHGLSRLPSQVSSVWTMQPGQSPLLPLPLLLPLPTTCIKHQCLCTVDSSKPAYANGIVPDYRVGGQVLGSIPMKYVLIEVQNGRCYHLNREIVFN